MSQKKAVEFYEGRAGEKRRNCAESVVSAFQDKFPVDAQTHTRLRSFGGGMAPGGQCGALYAARTLAQHRDPDAIAALEAEFLSRGGSLECRAIKAGRTMPCVECVRTAAGFLERI